MKDVAKIFYNIHAICAVLETKKVFVLSQVLLTVLGSLVSVLPFLTTEMNTACVYVSLF